MIQAELAPTYEYPYRCFNCGHRVLWQFSKGSHAPLRLVGEPCPKCGCFELDKQSS